MALADGTLLVCVCDDRPDLDDERPRIFVWRTHGPLETVRLTPGPRRLLGALVTPDFDVPSHLTPAAARRRVAAQLAAALPERSIATLRALTGYAKTQEWRNRNALEHQLDAQGLREHFGRVGDTVALRDATSDIAAIFRAVRDGRIDDAVTVLRAVAREQPGNVALDRHPGWDGVPRELAQEALACTISRWRGGEDPGAPDGEEIVDAVVVSEPLRSDDAGGSAALVVRPSGELVLGADRAPLARATRPLRRSWRRRRTRRTLAAIAVLAAVAAMVALTTAHGRRGIPPLTSAAAGAFPADADIAVANLTRHLPFRTERIPALPGDVVLVRWRFRTRSRSAGDPPIAMTATLSLGRESEDSVQVSTEALGDLTPRHQNTAFAEVRHVTRTQRLMVVPGTTRLLDSAGELLRRLPDLQPGRPQSIDGLSGGRIHFVETRVTTMTVPDGTDGEFAGSAMFCTSDAAPRNINPKFRLGGVATCSTALSNWGPKPLHRVRASVVANPAQAPDQIDLQATLSAATAYPRMSAPGSGFLTFTHPANWTVEYVLGSAAVVTPGRATLRLAGDPLAGGVTIPVIPVTGSNATDTPMWQFKFRIVARA